MAATPLELPRVKHAFTRAAAAVAESGLSDMFSGHGAIIVYAGRRYTTHAISSSPGDAKQVAVAIAEERSMAREPGVLRLHSLPDMGSVSVPLPAVAVVRDHHAQTGYATVMIEKVGH